MRAGLGVARRGIEHWVVCWKGVWNDGERGVWAEDHRRALGEGGSIGVCGLPPNDFPPRMVAW